MTVSADAITVQLAILDCVAEQRKSDAYRLMENHYHGALLDRARGLSLAYIHNDSDRVDAILKAFDDAYDKMVAGEIVSNLYFYLFAFVHNNLRNTNKTLRRFYNRQRPLESSLTFRGEDDQRIAELNGTGDDRLYNMKMALGQLGRTCRRVIRLKKLENQSHAKIVELVPEIVSASASAQRLKRCLGKLREIIVA